MTESQEPILVDMAGGLVGDIVDNAKRLGLTWTLRFATVITVTNNQFAMATYDGDTIPISMTSMIGPVSIGDRVFALNVPPSGNYIVGYAFATRAPVWSYCVELTGDTSTLEIEVPNDLNIATLVLDYAVRNTTGGFQAIGLLMRIDNDAGASYVSRYWQIAGATGTAGTHTAAFGSTSSTVGVVATAGAATNRMGTGRIVFPAWNGPFSAQLGWNFTSDFENALSDGWYLTGGGLFGGTGPYESVQLLCATGSFRADSQLCASGYAGVVIL